MVNYQAAALDATFGALADPTRRAILARLAQGETSVSQIAQPFPVSLPAISRHLRVLESAGLLARTVDGRVHRCRLEPAPMEAAAAWITRYKKFWEGRFDALEKYLAETAKEEPSWPPRKRQPRSFSRSRGPFRRRAKRSSAPGPTRKR